MIRYNIIQHFNAQNNGITLQNDLIRIKHNIVIIQNNRIQNNNITLQNKIIRHNTLF